ncbi:unnamed protein product [Oncorhynchus mykiss]|uniref:Dopamine beta-hydroxylase n=1 Tax=Oncorhynchus mykiss TaxID=8022 RepID=A0A060ZIP0_ONCMY|nr:unnamed protein product [Oncorhynchus mykiss]
MFNDKKNASVCVCSFYYPTDAGLPLGGPASSRFLRLEVHYHNPLLISGRKDNSGVRLYHTSSLRRYDAGIMELGLVYTPVMAIPPREQNFHLTGFCTSKCTQTALPSGGINIFASQLHTHLAGRGVRTVLVRGGREVKVVQEDKHFSTHYQVTPLGTSGMHQQIHKRTQSSLSLSLSLSLLLNSPRFISFL